MQNIIYENLLANEKQVCGVNTREVQPHRILIILMGIQRGKTKMLSKKINLLQVNLPMIMKMKKVGILKSKKMRYHCLMLKLRIIIMKIKIHHLLMKTIKRVKMKNLLSLVEKPSYVHHISPGPESTRDQWWALVPVRLRGTLVPGR